VLQLIAKELRYTPAQCTPRNFTAEELAPYPVNLVDDEDGGTVDFTPEELADLQNRAANAKFTPYT
jgi:hypothetical protein